MPPKKGTTPAFAEWQQKVLKKSLEYTSLCDVTIPSEPSPGIHAAKQLVTLTCRTCHQATTRPFTQFHARDASFHCRNPLCASFSSSSSSSLSVELRLAAFQDFRTEAVKQVANYSSFCEVDIPTLPDIFPSHQPVTIRCKQCSFTSKRRICEFASSAPSFHCPVHGSCRSSQESKASSL